MVIASALIIEDRASIAKTLAMIIKRCSADAEIAHASSHAQACKIFMQRGVSLDLVTMDSMIVDDGGTMNTVDLIKWLRQMGFTKKIIGVGGSLEWKCAMLAAGCDHWINKSEIAELYNLLQKI